MGDGEGAADAPVARAVHPDIVEMSGFDDVDGSGGAAFGFGVEGESGPEAVIEDLAVGVFFDVVDDDALGFDGRVGFQHVDDEVGAFELIFEMGGVDEDELVVIDGELDVFLEDEDFVAGILVETDFSDAEHVGFLEELGDDGEDFSGEGDVFGLFGVDAEPGEMREPELGGAFGFVVGELAEIVAETFDAASVEAGPEGGFANGGASGGDHGFVVVRGAADHVGVGFDVTHGSLVGWSRERAKWGMDGVIGRS